MDAPVEDLFTYKAFCSPSTEIRLITSLTINDSGCLELTLEHSKLDSARYQALSYTWGDELPTHRIRIDTRQAYIRTNLHDFLIHLATLQSYNAKSRALPLWTDAICIDQKNDYEKSEQVALMSVIYGQAEKVNIWLGEESKANVMADIYRVHRDLHEPQISFDKWFGQLLNRQRGQSQPWQCDACKSLASSKYNLSFERLWNDAINNIELNHYWKRLWIVQELILSGWSARLIIGGLELTLLGTFFTVTGDPHSIKRYRIGEVYDLQKLIAINTPRTADRPQKVPPKMLLSSIVRTCSKQLCFDARDKVFGLLGLTQRSEYFTIDYAMSMQQLLHEALKLYAHEQVQSNVALESESICGLFDALNLTGSQIHDYISNYQDHATFSSLIRRYTWVPKLQLASGEIHRMTFTARMSFVEQIHHRFTPCYSAKFDVLSALAMPVSGYGTFSFTRHEHSPGRDLLILAYHTYQNTCLNLSDIDSEPVYSTTEFMIDIGGITSSLLINLTSSGKLEVIGCAYSFILDYETYPMKVYFTIKLPERLASLLQHGFGTSKEGKLSNINHTDIACTLSEMAFFYECQRTFSHLESHFANSPLIGSGIRNRGVRLKKPNGDLCGKRDHFEYVLEHLSDSLRTALPSYSQTSTMTGKHPDSFDHNAKRREYEGLRSSQEISWNTG